MILKILIGWRADEPERSEGEEASVEENQGNLVYEGNIHRPSLDIISHQSLV